MQLSTLKNSFLSLTLVAIASVPIGLLTACSRTTSQNQASNPTTTATDTSDKQPMNHDGSMMNHGGSTMNHNVVMDLGAADANYDLRFIDAMIPHHKGAVEMAKVAQEKSKRPEIKKLTSEIIEVKIKKSLS